MGHGKAQRACRQGLLEGQNVGLAQILGLPLIGVLGEKLHGLAFEGSGRQQGIVAAARDRHVSTEERHAASLRGGSTNEQIGDHREVDDGCVVNYRAFKEWLQTRARQGPLFRPIT